MPRRALDKLDQTTLLLLLLRVLCASHVHAMPRPRGGIDESLCSPMFIDNIGPQLDSDCTRSTRAEHNVSTSTGEEYGPLSMARAAGGLEAVPMACNARICSVAAPSHQCLTHGLPCPSLMRRSGQLPNDNARRDRNGVFNQHCSDACSSAGLRSTRVTMRCRGWPRGFAQRLLFFSR